MKTWLIYAFGVFSGIVFGFALNAPNGHPILLLAIGLCVVWIVALALTLRPFRR